jgi:Tfp pilus assembly protein PilO
MTIDIKILDRVCLALVIIVSFACGYWVIKNTANKQAKLRQENEIVSKNLDELKSAEQNFANLNSLLEDTKKELELLDKRIPKSANIGEVLKEVNSFMKKREIVLLSMQPLPIIEQEIYSKISIRLMFKGSFANIYNLLYDFETMNRMLVTEKMSITRSNLDDSCQADLTASVYQRQRE